MTKGYIRQAAQGFTLIELLVVISIIAVLSSIVMAITSPVKAQARDATRTEEAHQIDTAVQLYVAANNHAPYLQNTCGPTSGYGSATNADCTAVSSADPSSPEGIAWKHLYADLQPYMSTMPVDPCSSGCTSNSGLPIGYTYVAPAAVNYTCSQAGTCGQLSTDSTTWYQIYAPLERGFYYETPDSVGALSTPYGPAPTFTLTPSGYFGVNGQGQNVEEWAITINVTTTFQQCSVSDTLGSNWTFTSLPNHQFYVDPATGVVDTVTATCSNQGLSSTKQTSVTGW